MFKLEGAFGHGLMDLKSLSLFVRNNKKKVFFFFFSFCVYKKKMGMLGRERKYENELPHAQKKKKKKKVRENKKGKDLRGSCGGEVRKVRKDLL